jgi:acetylornithine/N-succinyldiaminopimelate aminotransferase
MNDHTGQHPEGAKFLAPTYGPRPLTLVKGEGAYVWDDQGRRYLDFTGGVAVNSLGHSHPAVQRALKKQSAELIHVSNLFYNWPQCELAAKIVEQIGAGVVFFCNSGAEANEALIKLARKAGSETGRHEIISTSNSFHGRTLAGVSATGQDKVKKGFEPLFPGFHHVPYNDLDAVREAMTGKTAAVLIEGIQGEGGIIPADPEYLLGLRALTAEKGCLLLWDGVQCGGFRCGPYQSYTRLLENTAGGDAFLPDAIAMAKSIGGGFPLGATWIREDYKDVLGPGSHGSTYGGNPLACAVGLAVMDEILSSALDRNIREQGDFLIGALHDLAGQGRIESSRGCGGLIGMDVAGDLVEARKALMDAGLLMAPAGTRTLRWLPPLNVTRDELEQGLEIVKKTLL